MLLNTLIESTTNRQSHTHNQRQRNAVTEDGEIDCLKIGIGASLLNAKKTDWYLPVCKMKRPSMSEVFSF